MSFLSRLFTREAPTKPSDTPGEALRPILRAVADLEHDMRKLKLDNEDLWERVTRAIGRMSQRRKAERDAEKDADEPDVDGKRRSIDELILDGATEAEIREATR